MVNIESLTNYLGIVSEEEFMNLATKIYMITNSICEDYPNYKEWYFTKQLPAIKNGSRNILFVRKQENPSEIIAMACLKKEDNEQKICTVYVLDIYRDTGIGTAIIEKSMRWLGTTKPFITFADYKLDMFKPIIKKYDWKLTETVSGRYNNRLELCFNGALTKHNEEQQGNHCIKSLLKY